MHAFSRFVDAWHQGFCTLVHSLADIEPWTIQGDTYTVVPFTPCMGYGTQLHNISPTLDVQCRDLHDLKGRGPWTKHNENATKGLRPFKSHTIPI